MLIINSKTLLRYYIQLLYISTITVFVSQNKKLRNKVKISYYFSNDISLL